MLIGTFETQRTNADPLSAPATSASPLPMQHNVGRAKSNMFVRNAVIASSRRWQGWIRTPRPFRTYPAISGEVTVRVTEPLSVQ